MRCYKGRKNNNMLRNFYIYCESSSYRSQKVKAVIFLLLISAMVLTVYSGIPRTVKLKVLTLDIKRDLENEDIKWRVDGFKYLHNLTNIFGYIVPFESKKDSKVLKKLKSKKYNEGNWIVASTYDFEPKGGIGGSEFQFSTKLETSVAFDMALYGKLKIQLWSIGGYHKIYEHRVKQTKLELFKFCSYLVVNLPPVNNIYLQFIVEEGFAVVSQFTIVVAKGTSSENVLHTMFPQNWCQYKQDLSLNYTTRKQIKLRHN